VARQPFAAILLTSLPASRLWADLTTREFELLNKQDLVAVLPVGAIEQHGPHLPLSVDADINRILLARVTEIAPADMPILVLPMVEVGHSPEHSDFPGTLTLSTATIVELIFEIGASVARSGVRKLALFNTHGGQSQILDLVGQRLRAANDMIVASLNAYRYWDTAEAFGELEAANGIHGGAAETSIMLHGRPDAVRQDQLANFSNAAAGMEQEFEFLQPYGRTVGLGWQMKDLNPAGAAGDATIASAAAGAKLVDQAAEKTVKILQDLTKLDPDGFLNGEIRHSS
jgi:creatinine amidohydrolase